MSDTTYHLELAIRADEKAKSAHERLDRMNGSIDRLAGFVAETNAKIDALTASQAHSAGVDEGEATERKARGARWYMFVGAASTVAAALVAHFFH